jgi:hypothetical protein
MAYEMFGPGITGPVMIPGAPVAGTNEVQTLTIGGTPTGGTFALALDGLATAAIAWSATNGTLINNINAKLDARWGTGAIVAAVGTMTAGIGTATLTFTAGGLQRRAVSTMTVANNSLTGTSPTLAVAETTPGVEGTRVGAPIGARVTRADTGVAYINTGTALNPTWTVVGAQT